MTVLPDLERQLVRAAGHRARRRRGVIATAAGVAVVALVALVFASVRGQPPESSAARARNALDQAARAAAAGTVAPRLRPGQTWESGTLTDRRLQPGQPIRIGPRALRDQPQPLLAKDTWAAYAPAELLTKDSGGGRRGGLGFPTGAPGFSDWDALPVTPTFPTDPAAALRRVRAAGGGYWGYSIGNYEAYENGSDSFSALAKIAALLAHQPLLPAARAALWQAAALLPGLRFERVRAAFGALSVAVAARTSTALPYQLPNGSRPRDSYEFELIFDPATGLVLGSRTIALHALPALRIRAGAIVYEARFIPGRVVRNADVWAVIAAQRGTRRCVRRAQPARRCLSPFDVAVQRFFRHG